MLSSGLKNAHNRKVEKPLDKDGFPVAILTDFKDL